MRTFGLVAACLGLALAPFEVSGQDTEWNRYTLEGLEGVYVKGETGEACAATGFAMGSAEAAASARLLESDVALLSREEMLASAGLPELRITVECAPVDAADAVTFTVSVRLQQAAQMVRNTQLQLSESVTWYTTHLGVATPADASPAIETAIAEKVGEFITAFEEANAEGG